MIKHKAIDIGKKYYEYPRSRRRWKTWWWPTILIFSLLSLFFYFAGSSEFEQIDQDDAVYLTYWVSGWVAFFTSCCMLLLSPAIYLKAHQVGYDVNPNNMSQRTPKAKKARVSTGLDQLKKIRNGLIVTPLIALWCVLIFIHLYMVFRPGFILQTRRSTEACLLGDFNCLLISILVIYIYSCSNKIFLQMKKHPWIIIKNKFFHLGHFREPMAQSDIKGFVTYSYSYLKKKIPVSRIKKIEWSSNLNQKNRYLLLYLKSGDILTIPQDLVKDETEFKNVFKDKLIEGHVSKKNIMEGTAVFFSTIDSIIFLLLSFSAIGILFRAFHL